MTRPGELAIVLHTHMPYVEGGGRWPSPENPPHSRDWAGFGTWPFGEEWLWEAIATSYLPLLEVLGRAPVTLSLTPVLCDQLEAAGAIERCLRFLREVRPESHARDIAGFRQSGEERLARELERSRAEYAAAADRLAGLSSGLLAALGEHAAWTSSATHAVLPLMASDGGIALQVQTGIESHRGRFGGWDGGFWLPECAYAPWLDEQLVEAGVRAVCVELTNTYGLGDERHLQPLLTETGLLLWPVDRATMDRVWSPGGYPAGGPYRAYHRLTEHHHRVWAVDGAPYDAARAAAQARADAADFVSHVLARTEAGGVCVCALDTELLGHWWYEGVQWLSAVFEEAARQGLRLTTLDAARQSVEPALAAPGELTVSSWGEGGDLRTWSGPDVADLAWQARTAELEVLRGAPGDRALRELLALQSSDWAFLEARRLAGSYGRERAHGHLQALRGALEAGPGEADGGGSALRSLAPRLAGRPS